MPRKPRLQKKAPRLKGYWFQHEVLTGLEKKGIPASKQGLKYWLERKMKEWPESAEEIEGIAQDVLDPRHRMQYSPAVVRAVTRWSASQYLATSMATHHTLIPIAELAEQHGTTIDRIHRMAKNAILVIGRNGYASPALAAGIEAFLKHRGRAFIPPSNAVQNFSIAEQWIQQPGFSPEMRPMVLARLRRHLEEPPARFLQDTVTGLALELVQEKPGLAAKLFQRKDEWIPKSQRGIVQEGFAPETTVFLKLRRINPRLTAKQARAFILKEMGENRERFSGSYSEDYGTRRPVIPIAASNYLAERLSQLEEQRKQFKYGAQTTIPFGKWGSKLQFEEARKRVRAIPKDARRLRPERVARMLGIKPAMVERLLGTGQLEQYLELITTASLKKLFQLE